MRVQTSVYVIYPSTRPTMWGSDSEIATWIQSFTNVTLYYDKLKHIQYILTKNMILYFHLTMHLKPNRGLEKSHHNYDKVTIWQSEDHSRSVQI